MKIISATTRVTLGLICLAVSVWLVAFSLGMFPDRQGAVIDGRIALSENVALHCSLLATHYDRQVMKTSLNGLVQRNDDVQSVAIRRPDGSLLISVGPYDAHRDLPPGNQSTATQMRVPILFGDTEWGIVELRFREQSTAEGWHGWHPLVTLGVFTAAATYLLFFIYLRKMLQHLDPTRVVPRRVKQLLDNMAEGLLLLDNQGRILLANRVFAENIGTSPSELIGRKASELPFEMGETQVKVEGFPWERAMSEGEQQIGDRLILRDKNQRRVMKVSATPIYGEDGQQRGVLASFDDITQMEQSRAELFQMLDSLGQSRDEIQRQNLELERVASRDALTGCLNRRAFFTDMENHWSASERYGYPLSFIMIDLDHFKSINDTHGHQKGDLVLQKTAEVLRNTARRSDIVARYGGEEFCILLPHTDLDAATIAANQLRENIAAADIDGLSVTASIGVSSRENGAQAPEEMVDQADKCLYVAKRQGRNRVIRFNEAGEAIAEFEQAAQAAGNEPAPRVRQDEPDLTIPFHAVTGLVSALAYRDASTADHSRRVADLAVATARRLMTTGDSYVLENAALLHDIGKIGIPDSILLKPGKLTEDEWQIINSHERIGVEIVKATFSNSKLVTIIRTYRAWFGGNPRYPDLPTGEHIPLAARILAIADAYDAMTNQQTYRQSISRDEAFVELRRSAVQQFDPDLVERFIDTVLDGDSDKQPVTETSQAAAISFGTQIEALVEALDNHDVDGLAVLAHRLNMTAAKYDSAKIAEVASQLEDAARGDTDVKNLFQLTNELVDLCRSVQRAYLNDVIGPAASTHTDDLAPTEIDEETVYA